MSPTEPWTRPGRILTSLAIAAVLWIVVCETLPIAPESWQVAAGNLASRLGIGQGQWSMFTPPDGVNHRLRAELTLRDGRIIDHRFPDLTKQSAWQRFVGHRRSEYVDNAITSGQQYPSVWEALASYLVREHAQDGGGVAQVRIIVELAMVPAPTGNEWTGDMSKVQFDDQRVVFRRKYR